MARNGMAYENEELDWLRAHIDDAPWPVLAGMFNKRFPRRNRSCKGLQMVAASSGIYKSFVHSSGFQYTQEHLDWLKENRDGTTTAEIAREFSARFGCTLSMSAVEAKLHRLGVRRQDNHLRKPIGSERVSKGETYIKVRDSGGVGKGDWVLKSHFIWEQVHNEKVRRGDVIVFLDGDRRNFSPDNLYKVANHVSVNLRIYGWFFIGQRDLQLCAIKWCECAEYIRQHYNPDFSMKEWARRERLHKLY